MGERVELDEWNGLDYWMCDYVVEWDGMETWQRDVAWRRSDDGSTRPIEAGKNHHVR